MCACMLVDIFKRNVIFYIAAILLVVFTVDTSKVMYMVRLKVLDRLKPELCYLVDIGDGLSKPRKSVLERAVFFYNKLNEYIPSLKAETFYPDSYAMLGYCYYYLGDIDKAEYYYKKAISLNPVFVWFYHNLGVIYFHRGEYKRAADILQKAIETSPQINMKVISSSRIFTQIYASCAGRHLVLFDRQRIAYRDSFLLFVLSKYRLGEYQQAIRYAIAAIKEGLDDEGFFYYYAGIASFNLGQYKDTMFFLEECIKKRPYFADSYYYYALCLKSLGKEDTAAQFIQEAIYLKENRDEKMPDGSGISLRVF